MEISRVSDAEVSTWSASMHPIAAVPISRTPSMLTHILRIGISIDQE